MSKTKLSKINGMIWVTSVPKAIEFYTKKLGFELGYTCDEDGEIDFAIVSRDGIDLHLQVCICEDGRHTGNTFQEIEVSDGLDELCKEFDQAGVEFERCLSEEDWGKCFKISDPDGNWLMFTRYTD